ncbi:MAG: M1 family peptidase, partial [Bacteroidota bacterium]
MKRFFFIVLTCIAPLAWAQQQSQWQGKFEQLGQILPTPNEYRSASGAPGPKYWQQKADYEISVELNDDNQSINGS